MLTTDQKYRWPQAASSIRYLFAMPEVLSTNPAKSKSSRIYLEVHWGNLPWLLGQGGGVGGRVFWLILICLNMQLPQKDSSSQSLPQKESLGGQSLRWVLHGQETISRRVMNRCQARHVTVSRCNGPRQVLPPSHVWPPGMCG